MASRRSYKKLYDCKIDNQVWLIRVQHEWDFDEHQSWNFTCSVQCSKIRRLNIVLVLNKWECNTLLGGIDTTETHKPICLTPMRADCQQAEYCLRSQDQVLHSHMLSLWKYLNWPCDPIQAHFNNVPRHKTVIHICY